MMVLKLTYLEFAYCSLVNIMPGQVSGFYCCGLKSVNMWESASLAADCIIYGPITVLKHPEPTITAYLAVKHNGEHMNSWNLTVN
jgi:hypothetical protein